MSEWIFYPPVTFILILLAALFLSWLLGRLSFKKKRQLKPGTKKAYACGEDLPEHRVQVNYSQFFPFAFFFTILHVFALMIATVPMETINSFFIAVIYIFGALTGLTVLFRR